MNKVFAIAGAIALSIIPTPSFSGEVEQQEMSSVTKLLLPQIGEKFKNLDIKEKKEYKQYLINYLEDVQKTGATGVGEAYTADPNLGQASPINTIIPPIAHDEFELTPSGLKYILKQVNEVQE